MHLTGCNPLSTQDDVAAAMASLGVETFGVHGVDMQGYEDLLVETLKCRPHLIVDDGGDLITLLGGECAPTGTGCWAAVRRPPPASTACTPGSGRASCPAP